MGALVGQKRTVIGISSVYYIEVGVIDSSGNSFEPHAVAIGSAALVVIGCAGEVEE